MPHGRGYRDPRRLNRGAREAARRRVLAMDVPCNICGRPIDPTIPWPDPWSAEVDEVIPVSRGGSPTDLRNLAKVHRRCNQMKSDKSLEWARRTARGESAPDMTRTPMMTDDW